MSNAPSLLRIGAALAIAEGEMLAFARSTPVAAFAAELRRSAEAIASERAMVTRAHNRRCATLREVLGSESNETRRRWACRIAADVVGGRPLSQPEPPPGERDDG